MGGNIFGRIFLADSAYYFGQETVPQTKNLELSHFKQLWEKQIQILCTAHACMVCFGALLYTFSIVCLHAFGIDTVVNMGGDAQHVNYEFLLTKC
eukprot:1579565-Amphidinium_carterae.1